MFVDEQAVTFKVTVRGEHVATWFRSVGCRHGA